MGKKRDKEAKSNKKKNRQGPLEAADSETIGAVEAESNQPAGIVFGDNRYIEYVTTEDVMELVNSLDQNLDQLDQSTRLLQQQVAQNQQAMQRQLTMFRIIALVLVIGIFVVGYSATRSNAHNTDNLQAVATGLNELGSRIDRVDASIGAMSDDVDRLDNKLNALSTNVAGVNQIVNKLADDVTRIKNSNISQPYDPRRTGGYWR